MKMLSLMVKRKNYQILIQEVSGLLLRMLISI